LFIACPLFIFVVQDKMTMKMKLSPFLSTGYWRCLETQRCKYVLNSTGNTDLFLLSTDFKRLTRPSPWHSEKLVLCLG